MPCASTGATRWPASCSIRDVGTTIHVEPILGLPVIKDLIVDMEPFFEHYRQVMPYFVNDNPVPADGRERLQSQEEKDLITNTTNCILCAACTTSCPSFWANGDYVGPAAIVQAHRFIFDTRDDRCSPAVAGTSGAERCMALPYHL